MRLKPLRKSLARGGFGMADQNCRRLSVEAECFKNNDSNGSCLCCSSKQKCGKKHAPINGHLLLHFLLASYSDEQISQPQVSIQRTVLHRLREVFGFEVFRAFEICHGPCDFEDAVVATGGEAKLGDGVFHDAFALGA